MNKLYLVGYIPDILNKEKEWEFVGVFTDIKKARRAAKLPSCFIGVVKIDKDFGMKSEAWPEGEYEWPNIKKILK